ncbi:MAG: DUF6252 family protein [Flavobacteriaceae bacterium]
MKNYFLRLALALFVSLGAISCDTEPLDDGLGADDGPPTQKFFAVNFGSVNYNTNNAVAAIDNGVLTITATDPEGTFVIKTLGATTGTYSNSQLDFTYTYTDSETETIEVYTSIHPISSMSDSQLTISSINYQNKTITGTFQFIGYKLLVDGENTTVTEMIFSQGTFLNIPYDAEDIDDIEEPSGGDYLPMADGNIWNYTNGGVLELGSTEVLNGKTYYKQVNNFFMGDDITFTWPGLEEFVRKEAGNYYVRVRSTPNSPAPIESFEMIILKDNLSVGGTWSDSFSLPFTDDDGGEFTFNITVDNVVEQKDISYTVSGITYSNVIKIKSTNHSELIYNDMPLGEDEVSYTEMWFAKDVGIIKTVNSYDDPEWEDETHDLMDYQLN